MLSDGTRVACDVVVVGVGVAPATAWLAGSGLEPGGVRVDPRAGPRCRACSPRAMPPAPSSGRAAARAGAAAARAMLGLPPRPAPHPSFWSDQYGVRIQSVGDLAGADGMQLDGDPRSRNFTALLTTGGRVTGALLVGRPRELPRVRKLLGKTEAPSKAKEAAA